MPRRQRPAAAAAFRACLLAAVCLLAPLQRALAAAPHAFDPKRDSYERLLAASGGRPVVAYALQRSGSNLWLMLLHEAYGVQNYAGVQAPRRAGALQCARDQNTPLWKHWRPYDPALLADSSAAQPLTASPTAFAVQSFLKKEMCDLSPQRLYAACGGTSGGFSAPPSLLVVQKSLGPWLASTRRQCPDCVALKAPRPCAGAIPAEAHRERMWVDFYTFWAKVHADSIASENPNDPNTIRVVRVTYDSLLESAEACVAALDAAHAALSGDTQQLRFASRVKAGGLGAKRACERLHGGGLNVPRSGQRDLEAARKMNLNDGWRREFNTARAGAIASADLEVQALWG